MPRYRADIMMPRGQDQERLSRLPIAFPDDLYEWMRETAFKRRISMAELVREAVREHRERIDPQLDLWRGEGEKRG